MGCLEFLITQVPTWVIPTYLVLRGRSTSYGYHLLTGKVFGRRYGAPAVLSKYEF